MRSIADFVPLVSNLGQKTPLKLVSKRCHKAKMTKKSSEIARYLDFQRLYSLAYVFWKRSYKKIWIKMMKNLQNTAFFSLRWQEEIDKNLYNLSSCPNSMLTMDIGVSVTLVASESLVKSAERISEQFGWPSLTMRASSSVFLIFWL